MPRWQGVWHLVGVAAAVLAEEGSCFGEGGEVMPFHEYIAQWEDKAARYAAGGARYADAAGHYQDAGVEAARMQALNPRATFSASENRYSDVPAGAWRRWLNADTPALRSRNGAFRGKQMFDKAAVAAAEAAGVDYRTLLPSWDVDGRVRQQPDGCAGGWVAAAVAAVEAHHLKHGNTAFPQLAVEDVLHCIVGTKVRKGGACRGGGVDTALQWMAEHGVHAAAAHEGPREGEGRRNRSPCLRDAYAAQPALAVAGLAGVGALPPAESQMLAFLTEYGPVATLVCASFLRTYVAGVVEDCGCAPGEVPNHGVLIVGYSPGGGGGAAAPPHWVLMNSWGRAWGEGGYARITYGAAKTCELESAPFFPMVWHEGLTYGPAHYFCVVPGGGRRRRACPQSAISSFFCCPGGGRVFTVTVLAYSTLCLGVRLLFQFTFFPGRDHLGSAWEAYLDLRPLGTAWTCAAVAEDAARCASLPGCAFADGACDSAAWSRQLFLIVPYVWTDIFVLLAAKLCLRCVHWVRTSSAEPGAARATYDNRVAGLTCFHHPSNAGGGAAGCDDAASKTSKAEAGGARAYTEAAFR